MLNYKINNFKLLFLLISFMFIFSCGDKVPIKEMALARMEITNAISVNAKKYAPQEIGDAEKMLLQSHTDIKSDKLEDAKKSAEASRKKALEAYEKSIPLLAKDTLDIAKESMSQAEAVYAEVLAENEFKQAKNLLNEASGLYDKKDFYPCYQKSVEADAAAKNAKNVAIGKKDILKKSIAEIRATLEQAEKYHASTIAKDKVESANNNLKIAEDSYASLDLKKGFAAVEAAGAAADEAYLIAIKETAKGKIESAENLYAEAEKSDGAATAKDELKGAREALDQSKSLYQDSKYDESILSSDESARLSNVVLGAMKDSAKQKIAGAELVYTQAKESAGAAIVPDKLKQAKDALDQSKSQYDQYKYKDAVASANESERLSNIVLNTKSKGGQITAGTSAEDYYIYKVRLIPERRDCLWRIADKYYSNPFLWRRIYKANTDKIYNPDLIWPNMLLKVPKITKTSAVEEKKEAVEKPKQAAPAPETTKETPAPEKAKETLPSAEPVKEAPIPEKTKDSLPAPDTGKESTMPEKPQDAVPPPAADINKDMEPIQPESIQEAPPPPVQENEVLPEDNMQIPAEEK